MTATAVALRVGKNWGLGPIQFINVSLAFGYSASFMAGPIAGLMVGLLSQLLSDLLIFPGPWTIITSVACGLTSMGGYLLRRFGGGRGLLIVTLYLLTFLYDVSTSMAGYMLAGYPPLNALVVGLLGLFLPAGGGWLIGVGPTTELITAVITVSLIEVIRRAGLGSLYIRGEPS